MVPFANVSDCELDLPGGKIKNYQGVCYNCNQEKPGGGQKKTPRWAVRKSVIAGEPEWRILCNACKINHSQKKYCPYCNIIHAHLNPHDNVKSIVRWSQCGSVDCKTWAHVDCIRKASLRESECFTCPRCQERAAVYGLIREEAPAEMAAQQAKRNKEPNRLVEEGVILWHGCQRPYKVHAEGMDVAGIDSQALSGALTLYLMSKKSKVNNV